MLAVLNQCKVIDEDETIDDIIHPFAALIITDSCLYLTKSTYAWLMEKCDRHIDLQQTQSMIDLVEVENIDETSFLIHFLDEISGHNEKWECNFETSACLQSTYDAIAQSWEKLFEVPLAN